LYELRFGVVSQVDLSFDHIVLLQEVELKEESNEYLEQLLRLLVLVKFTRTMQQFLSANSIDGKLLLPPSLPPSLAPLMTMMAIFR